MDVNDTIIFVYGINRSFRNLRMSEKYSSFTTKLQKLHLFLTEMKNIFTQI